MSTRRALSRVVIIGLGCFAAATAVGFGVASLGAFSPLDSDRDGRVQMIVAGDSLSAGFYATTEQSGFVRLVSDQVGPIEVFETARAHQTLTTVAAITDVPRDVELAIVELGTNDVGAQTPLATFTEQYVALVQRIQTASPGARVACLGTWTGWGDPYDAAIESVCEARAGVYVPLGDLFRDAATRGPVGRETFLGAGDDFHPNDAGHAAIASAVLSALQIAPRER